MTQEEFKTALELQAKITQAEKIEEKLTAEIATLVCIPGDENYSYELDRLRVNLNIVVRETIAEYAKDYRNRFAAL